MGLDGQPSQIKKMHVAGTLVWVALFVTAVQSGLLQSLQVKSKNILRRLDRYKIQRSTDKDYRGLSGGQVLRHFKKYLTSYDKVFLSRYPLKTVFYFGHDSSLAQREANQWDAPSQIVIDDHVAFSYRIDVAGYYYSAYGETYLATQVSDSQRVVLHMAFTDEDKEKQESEQQLLRMVRDPFYGSLEGSSHIFDVKGVVEWRGTKSIILPILMAYPPVPVWDYKQVQLWTRQLLLALRQLNQCFYNLPLYFIKAHFMMFDNDFNLVVAQLGDVTHQIKNSHYLWPSAVADVADAFMTDSVASRPPEAPQQPSNPLGKSQQMTEEQFKVFTNFLDICRQSKENSRRSMLDINDLLLHPFVSEIGDQQFKHYLGKRLQTIKEDPDE